MKFNKNLLATTATFAAISLVGCSGGSTSNSVEKVTNTGDNGVKIEFWHGMGGSLGEVLNEIVDDFNKTVGAEKGIEVNSVYQGSYTDLKSKTVAAIKSGDSPNIIQGTSNDIAEYLQSGTVQALDQYIFDEEVGIDNINDIYQVYLDEVRQYDGESYYALPFSKSTDLLFYNKTFFEEHGLKVPTTWEEVEEASKQITEITGKPSFGIDNAANYLITMLHQMNGEYTSTSGEVLFNNEQALKALEMIDRNTKAGNWRLAGEDGYMSAPFLSELAHFYVGTSAGVSYLNSDNFEWDAAPVPQFDNENKAAIQQGNVVAVLNGNKTAEEVYGSYEFVKYLVSKEGNLKWSTNTGYLPIRESVAYSDEYQNYLSETKDSTKVYGVLQSNYSFYEPAFVNDSISSNMVRNEVLAMVEEVVLTDLSPQEALDIYSSKLK